MEQNEIKTTLDREKIFIVVKKRYNNDGIKQETIVKVLAACTSLRLAFDKIKMFKYSKVTRYVLVLGNG